jgi:putative membrane protein
VRCLRAIRKLQDCIGVKLVRNSAGEYGMKKFMYAAVIISTLAACTKSSSSQGEVIAQSDRDFVVQAGYSNMAEINAGDLASTKAGDSTVMAFGKMMKSDHQEAYTELQQIAGSFSSSVTVPVTPDQEHQDKMQQLMALSGHTFDTAYMKAQVSDHQRTIDLFQTEANSNGDARLKAYANKYLPIIRMHLNMADSISVHL